MSDLIIEQITDHADRSVDRLPPFQQETDTVSGFARIVGDRAQTVETVLWDALNKQDLDQGEGEQIDRIGRIVGEPRLGRSDADYIQAIDVRILVNVSNGSVPTLVTIAERYSEADVTLAQYYPMAVLVVVYGGTYNSRGLRKALIDAKASTVRLDVEAAYVSGGFSPSTLITFGTDGATGGSPTDLLDSAGSDFVTDGVAIGDEVRIYGPDGDAGLYGVLAVPSATQLQLDATIGAGKSGVTFDVRRNGNNTGGLAAVVSVGSDGATAGSPNPTATFSSAGATFLTDGVIPGNILVIAGIGAYPISSVPGQTSVVLSSAVLAASLAGQSYAILDITGAGVLAYLIL